MKKSLRCHRQPMLLKMLADNESFQFPVAQELSRCLRMGASILWVGHVFLMGLCRASLQELFRRPLFQVEWNGKEEDLKQAHMLNMCFCSPWIPWSCGYPSLVQLVPHHPGGGAYDAEIRQGNGPQKLLPCSGRSKEHLGSIIFSQTACDALCVLHCFCMHLAPFVVHSATLRRLQLRTC